MSRLFVILNPINYKQNKSYIQQWTGPTFTLSQVACVGEALSALAVSRCGRYIAIGSMTTGDVDIYIAYSLQVAVILVSSRLNLTGARGDLTSS